MVRGGGDCFGGGAFIRSSDIGASVDRPGGGASGGGFNGNGGASKTAWPLALALPFRLAFGAGILCLVPKSADSFACVDASAAMSIVQSVQ